MTYATQQDLVDRFGTRELVQLTDLDGTGEADAAELLRALTDTDGEIDGYLSGRYPLPLANIPKIIVGIACDIARYRLYKGVVTDLVKDRYQQAVRYLEQVAQGRITLGPDVTGAPVPDSRGGPQVVSGTRTFTADSLSGFTDNYPRNP